MRTITVPSEAPIPIPSFAVSLRPEDPRAGELDCVDGVGVLRVDGKGFEADVVGLRVDEVERTIDDEPIRIPVDRASELCVPVSKVVSCDGGISRNKLELSPEGELSMLDGAEAEVKMVVCVRIEKVSVVSGSGVSVTSSRE